MAEQSRLSRMAGTGRGMMAISLAGIVVLVVVGVLLAQVGLELNATTIGGLGGSLVVLFVVGWRSRRADAAGSGLGPDVRALRPEIEQEMKRLPARRETQASHDSLSAVAALLEQAERELAHGADAVAAQRLRTLPDLTADWSPDWAGREAVASLAARAARVDDLEDKTRRTLRQRPSVRARAAETDPVPPPTPQGEGTPIDPDRLPAAESYPSVMALLHEGDRVGATKEYRARTRLGLADADAAVRAAQGRAGLGE